MNMNLQLCAVITNLFYSLKKNNMKTTLIFSLSFSLAFSLIVWAFFMEDLLTTKMLGVGALLSAMVAISMINGFLWKNKKVN